MPLGLCSTCQMMYYTSGGSRISQTGGANPKGGADFTKNCKKMKKIGGDGGGDACTTLCTTHECTQISIPFVYTPYDTGTGNGTGSGTRTIANNGSWYLFLSRTRVNIFIARKPSLGQGNIFTSVCHLWGRWADPHRILWNMVNKRVVRILLEYILVA